MSGSRLINVRKLAALDIHFRGARVILGEFAFVVFGLGGLGLLALILRARTPVEIAISGYLVLLAVDYLPLLLYGIAIARAGDADREAQPEASEPTIYKSRYGVQQVMLLIPLVIPALAVLQESRKSSGTGATS